MGDFYYLLFCFCAHIFIINRNIIFILTGIKHVYSKLSKTNSVNSKLFFAFPLCFKVEKTYLLNIFLLKKLSKIVFDFSTRPPPPPIVEGVLDFVGKTKTPYMYCYHGKGAFVHTQRGPHALKNKAGLLAFSTGSLKFEMLPLRNFFGKNLGVAQKTPSRLLPSKRTLLVFSPN